MSESAPIPAPTRAAAAPAPTERLPRRFGAYLLFDRIGRGGMAEIFLARAATGLGAARLVVVKQILPELAGDAAFARMLVAEAKLAARLRHANVVQVYDLGREDERLFIAMEYVEGCDLNALLRQLSRTKTPLPLEFALFVVREVLSALSYAHRARDDGGAPLGLVHRDVSPSNVLISFEGEVKLCDFGIARALAVPPDESATPRDSRPSNAPPGTSRVVGKSAYMAPEQARGEAIDARADVFAAGILLWELCAGRRMYRGSEPEMLALARAGEVPSLPERGLPEEAALRELLARALAPSADARFASAADFQRELDAYASRTRLIASPLRFGSFLAEHFGAELIAARRSRERGALALELGPPAVLEPLPRPDASTAASLAAPPDASDAAPQGTAAPAPSPDLAAPTPEATAPRPAGPSEAPAAALPATPARDRPPLVFSASTLAIGAVTLVIAALLAAWLFGSSAGH
jgi:serine/threonine protein kinase